MNELVTEAALRLVFDSWAEPGPEVRAEISEDRHIIYEGSGIIVDLTLKNAGPRKHLQVGGQLLPLSESLWDVSNIQVRLETPTERLVTKTNTFGEFTFDDTPTSGMELVIAFKGRSLRVLGLSDKDPRKCRVTTFSSAGGN